MNELRSGVIAGGNWIVDYVKTIDKFPEEDNLANIIDETTCNGGSPYNVLINLARLGARFPLEGVGLLGDDEAAEMIRITCAKHGIVTNQLHTTDQAPTSYTLVMSVKRTGRRTFFHHRGANMLLSEKQFDFSRSWAKIFHLGYLLLLDWMDKTHPDGTVAAHVLKKAREAGLLTSIDLVSEDVSRFESVVLPALKYCDYCFMNEIEAERTTGIPLRLEGNLLWSHLHRAAQIIKQHGVKQWVIIHFPEGALALGSKKIPIVQPAIQVPKNRIKGVVGAGDAFAAGVLFGVHEGHSIHESLRYGVASAAACITDETTSDGVLPLAQALEIANRYGYGPVPELAV